MNYNISFHVTSCSPHFLEVEEKEKKKKKKPLPVFDIALIKFSKI